MKEFFVTCLLMLFATVVSSQCADSTKIYTFKFNAKKYEIVKELKTWEAAAKCAVERGGYLVEINSKEEQNALFNAVIKGGKIPVDYVSVSTGGGIAYMWIGATDKKTEGTWLWNGKNEATGINFWRGEGANGANNGKPILNAYTNWGGTSKKKANEPDNFGLVQNCAGIALCGWPAKTSNLGIAGEWNDLLCASKLYYIIEYND